MECYAEQNKLLKPDKGKSGANLNCVATLPGFFIRGEIMGCVYLAKNTVNGKCYIGKTIGTLEQRKRNHYNDAKSLHNTFNNYFHNALQKHKQKFEWTILYKNKNNQKLIEKEICFIKKYQTKRPNGYNLTNGGDGMIGYIYSEKSKKKMSESQKGKIRSHSEETKRKISKSKKGISVNLGHSVSKTTRKKISKTLKGHPVSKNTKKKISLALKGKGHPCSEKTKEKLSIINKGKHHSNKTKKKIGKASRGRKHSKETKKKISNTLKGRIFPKEWKRKISESKKKNNQKTKK